MRLRALCLGQARRSWQGPFPRASEEQGDGEHSWALTLCFSSSENPIPPECCFCLSATWRGGG